jgi:hypothetical protein
MHSVVVLTLVATKIRVLIVRLFVIQVNDFYLIGSK